jgi:cytochrome P450
VPNAVEEALRYDSPVQGLWRTTTRPVEMHGVEIPEGAKVMAGYAAANRDPAEFADPDEFRPDRSFDLHVAFGYGIHYCLGAPLARLETKVAIEGLLRRYTAVSPGRSGGRRLPTAILRGFGALHLDFAD